MDNQQHILTLLQTSQLFLNVSTDDLTQLITQSERVTAAENDILLVPGQRNSHIYLVLSGRLRIHLDPGHTIPITLFSPGECVGEMSIMDNSNVSAYVIADTETDLLAIPSRAIWSLIERAPAVARNLLHIMSQRMRLNDKILLDDIERQQRYKDDANTDELTRLRNRRWMNETFRRQLQRCKRNDQPSVLLILDVDHFKYYNDDYGHPCGDQVLRSLGALLPKLLRPQDMAARYGGEEFAIFLPETSAADALVVAERLRMQVNQMSMAMADGTSLPPITISVGLYASKPEDETLDQVMAHADAALYRAKEAGRNRVSD